MSEGIDLVFLMPNQAAKNDTDDEVFIVDFKELNREEGVLQNVFVNEYREIQSGETNVETAGQFTPSHETHSAPDDLSPTVAVDGLSLIAQTTIRSESTDDHYHYQITGDGADLLFLNPETGELFLNADLEIEDLAGDFTISASNNSGQTISGEFAFIFEDGALTFAPASPESGATVSSSNARNGASSLSDNAVDNFNAGSDSVPNQAEETETNVSVSSVTDNDTRDSVISESASNGDSVGITASASDANTSDSVTYSLSDDADGRFAIDTNTGEVTVADASKLDFEDATQHSITVVAESSDGSTSSETFTINLTDDTSESSVSAINDNDAAVSTISESSSNGDAVGITALASDADASDSVTYSLSDDADGRFTIDSNTGEVTVADASKLDFEEASQHSITVVAESSDGSTSSETFTINLADDTSESSVSSVSDSNATNSVISESVTNGDSVGITALASDADASDSVTYSLSDDADGRFTIDANTGEVTVADASKLDFEDATQHSITVVAESSDGSTSSETFTINLTDDTSESSVSSISDSNASNSVISESASNGDSVGITASASDADASDSVTYSLSDDADGRFAIDTNTGEVTVADASKLDFEEASQHSITVVAESSDGSTSSETFTINLTDDTSESSVSSISDSNAANSVISESATNGDSVGITASAADADASDSVTYSLSDDADGRFTIDTNTGEVTVADASKLDFEDATQHAITVVAESSDGSTSSETFTINLTDDTSESSVSAINDNDAAISTISESSSNGDAVGITALASDADASDSVTYSLSDDADGRFTIDANTGEVTVADASKLDFEDATEHSITVVAESSDGSTSSETFTINLTDDTSESSVSSVSNTNGDGTTISESSSNGDVVGITALASDADASDSITYSLSDDADGRFTIDANTGEVTVADASKLDFEDATQHAITVVAESSDGSTSSETFTINLTDDTSESSVSAISDSNVSSSAISESATNGDSVGITALASDADASDSVTYSLSDDADGRFTIDSNTGEVTVADASKLDFEDTTEHSITVVAESSDGSTSSGSFTINLSDDTSESSVSSVSDSNATNNVISESAANGDSVGITALASDADASDSVTYSLSDDADGRFTIDANTGEVTVADASKLDFEDAALHSITVVAESADGSQSSANFDINLQDANEGGVLAVADASTKEDTAVSLEIDTSNIEPGASATITINGVPEGAKLTHGTQIDNETWQLDPEDANNVAFVPDSNDATDVTLTVSLDVTEGGKTVTQSATLNIQVAAVADGPRLSVKDQAESKLEFKSDFEQSGNDSFVQGSLDGWSAPDGDSLEVWKESEVAGEAASGDKFIELNYESANYYDDAGKIERVIETDSGKPYSLSFEASPRPGFEKYMDMRVSAVDANSGEVLKTMELAWEEGSVSELNWDTYSMDFVGTGNDVKLVMEDIGDVHSYGRGAYIDDIQLTSTDAYPAGEQLSLSDHVDLTVIDNDGSETTVIEVTDIPDGFAFTIDGKEQTITDNRVEISPDQIDSAQLSAPDGFEGAVTMEINVTTTETSNGDTTTTNDTLDLNFVSNDTPSTTPDAPERTYDNHIEGTSKNDKLYGTDDNDKISGNDFNDKLYGEGGDDVLDGGTGNDHLFAGDGEDILIGGDGNDKLYGDDGDDLLTGGSGNDHLFGGDGNDIFTFGNGADKDFVDGGEGWTDVVHLEGADGGAVEAGWTYELDEGRVESSGENFLELSDDASGVVTLADGSSLSFENIERIEWT